MLDNRARRARGLCGGRVRGAVALGLAGLWLASCAAQQPSYDGYYARGRYEQAYASAVAVARAPGGVDRASLTAGLAAEALRRDDRARAWLTPIARRGSGELAARARAGLALIELRTGDAARAGRELEAAAAELDGAAGRRAASAAAEAYRRAGLDADAARAGRLARGLLTQADGGGYTLQVGAYSTRSRAQRRAAEVVAAARASGLGPPRVEALSRGGERLYSVRVGRFASEADAARALRTLGVEAIVADAR